MTALLSLCFFFFNDTATTEIYTLSLHDALPIYSVERAAHQLSSEAAEAVMTFVADEGDSAQAEGLVERSEEHTSELQSLAYIGCRLLLSKTKTTSAAYRDSSKSPCVMLWIPDTV